MLHNTDLPLNTIHLYWQPQHPSMMLTAINFLMNPKASVKLAYRY